MRMSDLTEGMRRSDAITKKKLFQAIRHFMRENDDEFTHSDLRAAYDEIKPHLNFPQKVYRALYFDDFDEYDDDFARLSMEQKVAHLMGKINWKSLGTSWTWDEECAQAGGVLDNAHDRHVVISATVPAQSVDLIVTLWMNLTDYAEEKEIRLFPNVTVKVDDVFIEIEGGIKVRDNIPRANSGAESWDRRDSRLEDIKASLLAIQKGVSVGQAIQMIRKSNAT